MYSKEGYGLSVPKLILSVTGGAQNFTIPHRMKKAFKEGLIKVAATTGAWIITGGTNAGVMRLVGEAVAEEYPKYSSDTELTVLGIATWGKIAMREKLEKAVKTLSDKTTETNVKTKNKFINLAIFLSLILHFISISIQSIMLKKPVTKVTTLTVINALDLHLR